MKSIVFDLDGTLADTSGDLLAAANACFENMGHPAPLDLARDQSSAFAGGRAMLRLGLGRLGLPVSDAVIEAQWPDLIRFYDENIDVHTRLYPGVEDALDRLLNAGYRLGICTNKPENLANKLLRRLNLNDHFQAMLGADSIDVRKPAARHVSETVSRMGGQLSDAVLVGDTINDREAAKNAGIPCILVLFGPEGEGIRRLNAEAYLPSYEKIEAVLASLA